jgi:hypothetical protein
MSNPRTLSTSGGGGCQVKNVRGFYVVGVVEVNVNIRKFKFLSNILQTSAVGAAKW